VFYDGLAINDAQSGEIDLSKFSLDNLQSISLYNNNHQDIAQPAKAFASASALYLESRLPIFNEGKRTNIRARLAGGSFGSINPSLFIQQKVSENTSFSLSTEWMKANGEYDFHYKNQALLDTVIRRKNTDLETVRVETGFQGKLKDSSEWRVNGYVYLSERGLPGPALNNNYYAQDRQDDKNLFLQSYWNKEFSNFYQLKVSGKYSYNWMRYLDPHFQNTAGRLENFYTQKEIYLSAVNVFQFTDQWKASISTDYFNNQLDANLVSFAYPKRNTGLVNFAMDYQNSTWRVQGNLLSTFVQDKVLSGSAAESKTAISPSLSFSLKPFDQQILYLRGSYKSIFRLPTFNDSYYTLIGSTSLKPEYVKEFNVGLTLQKEFDGFFQSITFKTDAYHNNIKDRITAIPRSFRWTMINIGKVEIEGLEMGLQSRLEFTKDLHAALSINTTFQKGIDITPNGNYYGQDIPYSPRNSSSASAAFHYRSWGLSTSSLYSGAKYSGRENRAAYYLGEWFIQDLSLSYEFKLPFAQIKLLGEVNNLFNADYVVMENYPMPGTNYRASIHINY
jgi:outer membrane cobalamin receptor